MQKCGRPLHRISSNEGGWWHWQAECEGKPLLNPSARVSSVGGGGGGRQSVRVNHLLVFRATEGGGGRQTARENPPLAFRVTDGGWWGVVAGRV